ncbi:methyltransferase domain-containing protein [Marivibrio halodurans]|uniref:Methyltransferase domain-containing protein n=1 Tax=Marivibrio halodurans TaxID=2039722 RepID=A0A8J7SIA7_9PROT|nr:methyltransferase domain-containing protein [Marivibrio halodurans]MBP5856958.1 methyltransferase domain-containing protein [Marivibrio halodurans]
MTDTEKFFEDVYGLDRAKDTKDYYERWAEQYDEAVLNNGYASPRRVAEAMAAHVADKSAPLLDLGCGTGLSGESFAAAGFTTIDGSDFSEEMLAVARTKGVYRHLEAGDLNRPIPAQPGDYADIAAVGVFSPGHAPAEMIGQVMDLLPPGGCFGFTLNDHAIEERVYENEVGKLAADGRLTIVFEDYGDHLPGQDLKSKVLVLRTPS